MEKENITIHNIENLIDNSSDAYKKLSEFVDDVGDYLLKNTAGYKLISQEMVCTKIAGDELLEKIYNFKNEIKAMRCGKKKLYFKFNGENIINTEIPILDICEYLMSAVLMSDVWLSDKALCPMYEQYLSSQKCYYGYIHFGRKYSLVCSKINKKYWYSNYSAILVRNTDLVKFEALKYCIGFKSVYSIPDEISSHIECKRNFLSRKLNKSRQFYSSQCFTFKTETLLKYKINSYIIRDIDDHNRIDIDSSDRVSTNILYSKGWIYVPDDIYFTGDDIDFIVDTYKKNNKKHRESRRLMLKLAESENMTEKRFKKMLSGLDSNLYLGVVKDICKVARWNDHLMKNLDSFPDIKLLVEIWN